MVEGIKRAGSLDLKKVIAALHEGNYPTVIGSIAFDRKGDVTKPDYIIYQWTKGLYTPVEGQ
jgi:branched-chain amino acid transport system substrate-binding protein